MQLSLTGMVCHRQVGTFNLCTKFEVSNYVTIWYSTYDFLFNFKRNRVSIWYCFWDIESYLLKVAHFHRSHLHLSTHWGWPHSNFIKRCGIRKPESLHYYVALFSQVWLVTETQTYMQWQHTPHNSSSRGKKNLERGWHFSNLTISQMIWQNFHQAYRKSETFIDQYIHSGPKKLHKFKSPYWCNRSR